MTKKQLLKDLQSRVNDYIKQTDRFYEAAKKLNNDWQIAEYDGKKTGFETVLALLKAYEMEL